MSSTSIFEIILSVRGRRLPSKNSRFTSVQLAWVFFVWMMGSSAQAEVLLSLKSGEQTLEITREQLEALPQHDVRTTTAWTDGVRQFKGPLLRDVLGLLEQPVAGSATARLIALNEYEVKVVVEDYQRWDVILAHQQDGTSLTRADKGPLWVVYPRDHYKELQDSRVDHRWAWMLRAIVIEP